MEPGNISLLAPSRNFVPSYRRAQAMCGTSRLFTSRMQHERQRSHGYRNICRPLASSVPQVCFTALGRSQKVSHLSIHETFQLVRGTLDGKEAVQSEDMNHFKNFGTNKESAVEDRWLRDTVEGRYAVTNQVFRPDIDSDGSSLIYAQWHADLDGCIEWLMALWRFNRVKSHFLSLPGIGNHFGQPGKDADV